MDMWILIIFFHAYGNNGVSVTTQEFNSQSTCYIALESAAKIKGNKINSFCVKK